MKEFHCAKHSELFLGFTRYLTTHPRFSGKIPEGAEVILLDSRDKGYTRFMLKNAPKGKVNVVFVDVGELAPIQSRLRKPKIIARPSAALTG